VETDLSGAGSRGPMPESSAGRPSRGLVRDLLVAAALAAGFYLIFGVFNARLFHTFSITEVLLLEAGALVLVAMLVARAVTNAATKALVRQGLGGRGPAVRLFLNMLVAVAAVFALFRLAGVSADSILLGAGFTGIVLGLAAQTVLANVFAGFLIVFADPFRPGDRISLVSSNYGILAPSYPHEALQPGYAGIVEDIGLVHTVLTLDNGAVAKVPNAVVITAMVIAPGPGTVHRVRVTFPPGVPVAEVEAALPEIAGAFPAPFAGAPPPRLEVADLAPTGWDGVVVLWSPVRDSAAVRDRVLRVLAGRLGGSLAGGAR
jgi:small-conductance mechanosensitive channel